MKGLSGITATPSPLAWVMKSTPKVSSPTSLHAAPAGAWEHSASVKLAPIMTSKIRTEPGEPAEAASKLTPSGTSSLINDGITKSIL